MSTIEKALAPGLEGVIAAETRLSDVDGERGRLVIAGHDVEALAGSATFEDVLGLLATGHLPDAERRAAIARGLGEARARADARLGSIGDALDAEDGMDALRAGVASARLGPGDDPTLVLGGAVAVTGAAWLRRRAGAAPVAPDPSLPHAADLLRLVRGGPVAAELAAGLDAYLVTVADHGMNASTFAARVVASTGSDAVSAIVAAIGALKGPLHGGAPGPVLDMLDAIGAPERALAWLEAELAAGRRIMGMGHRVYRVRDPRAAVLERTIERLERAGFASGRLPLARAVEAAATGLLRKRHPARPLHANVEFYTSVLLDLLGIPREGFTLVFAAARTLGWCAHVEEERRAGRLIRPQSRYVGPAPG